MIKRLFTTNRQYKKHKTYNGSIHKTRKLKYRS